MPDAAPPVDLASLAAGGNHPGTRSRLDGEDLQANLVRLDQGDPIAPHRNDEVEVLMVIVSGRGELTVDGQVHQLVPMVVAHLPRGRLERSIEAVGGAAGVPVGPPPWLLAGRQGEAAPRPGCAVGLDRLDAWEAARKH